MDNKTLEDSMQKQDKTAVLVIAAAAAIALVVGMVFPGAGAATEEDDTSSVVYDLYRAHGDCYCHLGDTVTFEAQVIPYFDATAIGDEGAEDPLASSEDEATASEEGASGDTEESTSEDIDYSQFQFQWYYCQHVAETGEIVYIPIEGANEPSLTIDRVTEANLYDSNDELEYVLAMFPADATDLSYGNRCNISSIWFCLSLMPDYVDANTLLSCVSDSTGNASEGNFVAFATPTSGEFTVSVSNVSDPNATISLYLASIYDGRVVAEDEFDVDGSFTYDFDAADSYVLAWSTDSDGPVSFNYQISGDVTEPVPGYVDVTPSDAGLNAYVSDITIRSDGEYQLTVENPWVNADYVSSDESVATVSDDGKIWAVAPGETTVTVSQGDESQDILVTVV